MQATEPPTIANGEELADGLSTAFLKLADVYGRGAQTVAALTPSTEADLQNAIAAVQKEAEGADPENLPDLDPGVEAAVEQLPECSKLGF